MINCALVEATLITVTDSVINRDSKDFSKLVWIGVSTIFKQYVGISEINVVKSTSHIQAMKSTQG